MSWRCRCAPLDAVLQGQSPALIKIDVEGFETAVLAGAEQALADPGLLAVIMELNGGGARYGFDEDALHRDLSGRGFETFRYRPFERALESLQGARSGSGNTLYVRGCRAVGRAGAIRTEICGRAGLESLIRVSDLMVSP